MRSRRCRLAVVLLSGGLDSATAGAWAAKVKRFRLIALTVNYGQRHAAELAAARKVARRLGVERHVIVKVELDRLGGSALTDRAIPVPKVRPLSASRRASRQATARLPCQPSGHGTPAVPGGATPWQARRGIPVTYVPARNTVFLALALGLAEVAGAREVVIGVNARDYSGYPDCRPAFVRAFERLAALATKAGVAGHARFRIHAPLLHLGKGAIIRLGARLGVDFALTHSCYDPLRRGGRVWACGRCDSCRLRLKGFRDAGLTDPLSYRKSSHVARASSLH